MYKTLFDIFLIILWGNPDYPIKGFRVLSLCRWDPGSEDTQRPGQFAQRRTENVLHWKIENIILFIQVSFGFFGVLKSDGATVKE